MKEEERREHGSETGDVGMEKDLYDDLRVTEYLCIAWVDCTVLPWRWGIMFLLGQVG